MAPEIFSGNYSPSSDLWAIGTILYEMLTGALPFPHRDMMQLMMAVQTQAPADLPQSVPPPLKDVVVMLLSKAGADRFATADQTRLALQAAMVPGTPSAPISSAPSLESSSTPNNLPSQMTSFVGREHQIAEIKELLAETRLLTLTGSGGCGKTRLVLRAAEEMLQEYPDGIWLAELAPLSDPDLVASVVARAVGVLEAPGQPLITTLGNSIKAIFSRRLFVGAHVA